MKERSILKNKYYLYLTEFFSGVSVMAVELGASRLLAPYFSSSQIVWTIIIGTIMIALALGNLWGGRTADRNPTLTGSTAVCSWRRSGSLPFPCWESTLFWAFPVCWSSPSAPTFW